MLKSIQITKRGIGYMDTLTMVELVNQKLQGKSASFEDFLKELRILQKNNDLIKDFQDIAKDWSEKNE